MERERERGRGGEERGEEGRKREREGREAPPPVLKTREDFKASMNQKGKPYGRPSLFGQVAVDRT